MRSLPAALLLGGAALLLLRPPRSSGRKPDAPKGPVCPPVTPGSGTLSGYEYLEVTTGGADLSESLPIIILLHGRGSQPKKLINLLSGIGVKSRVVIPRGNGGSPEYPLWYELRAATEKQDLLAKQMQEEASRLSVFVEEINLCLRGKSLPIVVGHSQGGGMALALGSAVPGSIKAVVAAAAWLPLGAWSYSIPNTTMIHGSEDKTVDYDRSKELAEKIEPVVHAKFETIDGHGHGLSGGLLEALKAAVEIHLLTE
jgi:phospholipase/carboxylesterase